MANSIKKKKINCLMDLFISLIINANIINNVKIVKLVSTWLEENKWEFFFAWLKTVKKANNKYIIYKRIIIIQYEWFQYSICKIII